MYCCVLVSSLYDYAPSSRLLRSRCFNIGVDTPGHVDAVQLVTHCTHYQSTHCGISKESGVMGALICAGNLDVLLVLNNGIPRPA